MKILQTNAYKVAGVLAVPPKMFQNITNIITQQLDIQRRGWEATRLKKEVERCTDKFNDYNSSFVPFTHNPDGSVKELPYSPEEKEKRARYAVHYKKLLEENKAKLKELRSVKNTGGIMANKCATHEIPIDLTDWPYANRVPVWNGSTMTAGRKTIKLVICNRNSPNTHSAAWFPGLQEIQLFLKNYQTQGEHSQQLMEADVEHELRHFTQDFLNRFVAKGNADWVSRPPKSIRTPDFNTDMSGRQMKDWTSKGIDTHHMSDTEFYTDLGDSIRTLRNNLSAATDPKAVLESHLKYDKFLRSLRNHPDGRGKLQQALKDIYKAYHNATQQRGSA